MISARDDAHLPHVTRHLTNKPLVIDPMSIVEGARISFAFERGQSCAFYQGVPLTDIKSVWYRKPHDVVASELPVPEEYMPYSYTAIKGHIALFRTYFRGARWVSDYYAIQRASNKEWQMTVASKIGLCVPDTVITSDPHAAAIFAARHNAIIVKPMGRTFPAINSIPRFFFAKRIEKGEKIDFHNLHLAPAIFQQAIDTIADIRVTVIGDKVFAAKIVAPSTKAGVRDWRHNFDTGQSAFEPYDYHLPSVIAEQCRRLVRQMNLLYGAIDLVLDKKGQFWFLEINPNGQWAFIEDDTGQPMGKALAGLLEGRR